MKNKIQTYVQLYSNDVELNISMTKKLKKQTGSLKKFGFIQISSGEKDKKECFWDNLDFFLNLSKENYKEKCEEDLKKGNFDIDKTYNDIKILIKRAIKLNII